MPYLHLFADESGSFKVDRYFAIGIILLHKPNRFLEKITEIRHGNNYHREIKYAKNDNLKENTCKDVWNYFLSADYIRYAIIIVPRKTHDIRYFMNNSLGLPADVMAYNHKYRLVIEHNISGEESILTRDRHEKSFIAGIGRYLRREIPQIKDVMDLESKKSDILQISDLITGSIREDFEGNTLSNNDSVKRRLLEYFKSSLGISHFDSVVGETRKKINVWLYRPQVN